MFFLTIIRNNYLLLTLVITGLVGLSACKSNDGQNNDDADKLYFQSKDLLLTYIGKMQQFPDSCSIDSLSQEFEKELTKINFSVAPGTDALLTNERNDTLSQLTTRYVNIRNKRLGKTIYQWRDSVYNSDKID